MLNSRILLLAIGMSARFIIISFLVFCGAHTWIQKWLPDLCGTLGGKYRRERSGGEMGYQSWCELDNKVLFHDVPSVIQNPTLATSAIGALLLWIVIEGTLWIRRNRAKIKAHSN